MSLLYVVLSVLLIFVACKMFSFIVNLNFLVFKEVGGAEAEVELADPDLGSENESNMEVATSSVPAIFVTPAHDDTPQLSADEQDMESDNPQLESIGG